MRDLNVCEAAERRGTEKEAHSFFHDKKCPACGSMAPRKVEGPNGSCMVMRCPACGGRFCCDDGARTLCVLRPIAPQEDAAAA